jgi:hypothetical protein
MVLARQDKRGEAAELIAPVVTTYRSFNAMNHGDQWLPLELAEALYAQSLTDPQHADGLLREAVALIDYLLRSIAQLHDTGVWRKFIEEAQLARRSRRAS